MQKSSTPLERATLSLLASVTLAAALSACASRPQVFLNASPCADLVPGEWLDGVPAVPPPSTDTVGAWIENDNAQVGQLDKANDRTKDTHTIVAKCEARDREVAAKLKPKPLWQFWHWFG